MQHDENRPQGDQETTGCKRDNSAHTGIPCLKCSYDLQGLPPEGVCPECGCAVDASRRVHLTGGTNPAWMRTLRLGIWAMLLTLGVSVAEYLIWYRIAFAMNLDEGSWLFDPIPISLWGSLACVRLILEGLSVYCLTTPAIGHLAPSNATLSKSLRILVLCAAFTLSLLIALKWRNIFTWSLLCICGLLLLLGKLRYLCGVPVGPAGEVLHKRTRRLLIWLVAMIVLHIGIIEIFTLRAEVPLSAPEWRLLHAPFFLLLFGTLIWLCWLLLGYAREFRRIERISLAALDSH